MKLINIGVIGCADIASRSVIPSILSLNNRYKLIGVASRNKDKANVFASKFNTKPFQGYDELIGQSELDAVYIPLPNALHAEWIELVLRRNIHVLVEKSMACSYNDVVRLNDLAFKRNLVLVENFQFRFHPQLGLIKKKIETEEIGELRCLRSSFGFPPFKDENNIRYQKELGGGCLLDAGAYPLKIAQIFLGEQLTVDSSNLKYDKIKNVDIWGGAYLRQSNGPAFAQVAFGFDNYYQCNLELWGSKGRIYTNRIFTAPPNYSPEICIESNGEIKKIKVAPNNHFEEMLIHFSILIKTKKNLSDEYSQNINQSRLVHEVRQKAH